MEKPTRNIIVALIGAAALVIAAAIPSWLSGNKKETPTTLPNVQFYKISGTVLDARTNDGVYNARISILGNTAFTHSDNNGFFTMEVSLEKPQVVNIRVSKDGFKQYEQAVTPPIENLPVMLRK
jgi:hypothetical protein